MKVLHITPHLGGGVGTVVLNWIEKEHEVNQNVQHKIACLEKNKNDMQAYLDLGIAIHDDMYSNQSLLMEWVNQADIVLIHWWNHPALFDIMVNSESPLSHLKSKSSLSSIAMIIVVSWVLMRIK